MLNNNKNTSNNKIAKIKVGFKKVFPHVSSEITVLALILAVLIFAATLGATATFDQEKELMDKMQEMLHATEPPPTQYAEFEVVASEPPKVATQTIEYPTSQMCFIGDSRTVQMDIAVVTDVKFIAKGSMGLEWFNDTASVEFEKIQNDIGLCVVALGINDIHNVDRYIERLNEFAEQYPDKVLVYVNLGPVDETRYTGIPNSSLEKFNDKMRDGLSDRWQILDQYAYLTEDGFGSGDGLHYSARDSAKIFAWIVDNVKTQTIEIAS